MTVIEHLAQHGYNVSTAKETIGLGTMECVCIDIKTRHCRPWQYGPDALAVEATAIVPFTDGTMQPYPMGWDKSRESSITAYFPI
jgi:hypothetical protein